jgi:PAS domain S-box-containing protein
MPADSAERRYFKILDTAPDAMIVVDPSRAIAFVNAQAEKLFGWPREELLGQSLDAIVPARFRDAHGAHVARYFAKPGTRPMGSGIELFGLRKDGSEIAIEVSLSPVYADGGVLVSAAIRDISERKRMETSAKLATERLASAVESMQDAFALFDADDRLVLCNAVYRGLFSSGGELVGETRARLLARLREELGLPKTSRPYHPTRRARSICARPTAGASASSSVERRREASSRPPPTSPPTCGAPRSCSRPTAPRRPAARPRPSSCPP